MSTDRGVTYTTEKGKGERCVVEHKRDDHGFPTSRTLSRWAFRTDAVRTTRELNAKANEARSGPQIRPTLLCNLEGKPFTSDGFRSNWHRLMTSAMTPGK